MTQPVLCANRPTPCLAWPAGLRTLQCVAMRCNGGQHDGGPCAIALTTRFLPRPPNLPRPAPQGAQASPLIAVDSPTAPADLSRPRRALTSLSGSMHHCIYRRCREMPMPCGAPTQAKATRHTCNCLTSTNAHKRCNALQWIAMPYPHDHKRRAMGTLPLPSNLCYPSLVLLIKQLYQGGLYKCLRKRSRKTRSR